MTNRENIVIENAKIAFTNFSGKEGTYNREGDRNFCVFLEDDVAEKLKEDGWNVKYLKPRDEEDSPKPYMKVNVKFSEQFPMTVILISSNGKTRLDEDSISTLDWAEIDTVDMIVRPYNWEVNGKSGVAAYLKAFYATLVEDELSKKYVDVPDSAKSSIGGCGNCEVCDGGCKEDQ